MKIEKSQIFIGIGGILVGALAYKYFYSPKQVTVTRAAAPAPEAPAEDDSADESATEDNANFLGFGKRKMRPLLQPEAVDKVKKAYVKSLKMGVSPAFATKDIATKIRRSRASKKEKMMALSALRDASTKVVENNFDGDMEI